MSKKRDQTSQEELLTEAKQENQATVVNEKSLANKEIATPQPNKAEASSPHKTKGKNNPPKNTAPNRPSTPGQMLKKARLDHQWSVERVAKQLRLAPAYIEEMEADQYQKITSLAYAKGYLRAYSRLLNICADTVMTAFNQMDLLQETATVCDPSILYTPAKMSHWHKKYWVMGATALACLLIIGVTLLLPAKNIGSSQKPVVAHDSKTTQQPLPLKQTTEPT